MSEEQKTIDLREFQSEGFLMEANRQFFHPLGLALGIYWDEDDPENKKGIDPAVDKPKGLIVYDVRDDPEGSLFASLVDPDDWEKHENVARLRAEKGVVRLERYGFTVQPMGSNLL